MEAGQRCAARYGCRGLLLMLHRAGHIGLPPVRYTPPNPLVRRARPAPVRMDTTPLQGLLSQLRPLHFQQVRRTGDEPVYARRDFQHPFWYSGSRNSGCTQSAERDDPT